jgi:hypothetical protein
MVDSLDFFFNYITISRFVRGNCKDVFVADYFARQCLVCFGICCLGESVRLAIRLALNELDSVVELFILIAYRACYGQSVLTILNI